MLSVVTSNLTNHGEYIATRVIERKNVNKYLMRFIQIKYTGYIYTPNW
jgi:hypothetical protein